MSEKFYLGLSLGFNSSACVISNERGLVSAISQERLNGKKNTKELPFEAAIKCLQIAGAREIEKIAISHYEEISNEYFEKYDTSENIIFGEVTDWKECIINVLENCAVKIKDKNIVRVQHHEAHKLSTFAFYGMPQGQYYTITSDGFGDGLSGQITFDGEVISNVTTGNSIALVYQFVTGALGFKMHQHEGKITGLAAFGQPKYVKEFEKLYDNVMYGNSLAFKDRDFSLNSIEAEQVANSNIIGFDLFLKLKKAVFAIVNSLTESGATREDIAASVQEFSEKYTLKWIEQNCYFTGLPCYIAGGLFANVKINQRIKDLGIFSDVYICPAMGDEGTAVGAAVAIADFKDLQGTIPQNCGTEVGTDQFMTRSLIETKLDGDDYSVTVSDDMSKLIADRLADNKIVCLMRDTMEFGPRALCHRSILYNCDTKETNDWLNRKLSRTEFMPFAPVCRKENADDLFVNLDGGRDSAKFMTMTFDCTEEFAQNYPAACHIDNTARPQIVSRFDDPFIWNLLKLYEEKTGKKALINTSFNLHNWPIIENEEVGIDSWLTSDTDCLVIGNIMIEKK